MIAKEEKPSPTTSETHNTDDYPARVIAPVKKKPYIKPTYRMDKVFVTTAALPVGR